MKKLILFLLLILIAVPSVTAFTYKGVECSTDTTKYHYADVDGFNITGAPGTNYIDIEDIASAEGKTVTIFVLNTRIQDGSGDGGGGLNEESPTYPHIYTYFESGSLRYTNGTGRTASCISTSTNYVNWSGTEDLGSNKVNYTMDGSSSCSYYESAIDDRGTKNIEYFRFDIQNNDVLEVGGVWVWNRTDGQDACPTDEVPEYSDSLNLSSPQPPNNTQYSVPTLTVNLTANSSSAFNCNLYLNDTYNQTRTSLESGINIQVDFNLSFDTSEVSHYVAKIGCWNTDNDTNSSETEFYIDRVDPSITWTTPSSTNSTILNIFDNSVLTANILLQDTSSIYSYEYNVTQTDGTVLYDYSKTNILESSFTVTNETDMENYTGVFRTLLRVCDGHTAKLIDDWNNVIGHVNKK